MALTLSPVAVVVFEDVVVVLAVAEVEVTILAISLNVKSVANRFNPHFQRPQQHPQAYLAAPMAQSQDLSKALVATPSTVYDPLWYPDLGACIAKTHKNPVKPLVRIGRAFYMARGP